jgi:hypothetical protein
MSNFLAIATVTEGLRRVLHRAVSAAQVTGALATAVRPAGNGAANGVPDVGVNAYLYQVSPNPAWRNAVLPTRAADGALRERSRLALDLHYLLTFYGDEADLEPQRLLGSVVSTLDAQPLLDRDGLRRIVADASDANNPDPPHPYLAASNLAEQVDLVRFTPLVLDLEQLSKLWSVFFQSPYVLSACYQGTVVLIETDDLPAAAPPVRRRAVHAIPLRRPVIEAVSPQLVQAGGLLTLRGRNLAAATAAVVFDRETDAPALNGGERELIVAVPAALRAGIRTVHVRHDVDLGTPSEPHRGFTSNLTAFALAPVITSAPPIEVARGHVLTIAVDPAIGRRQEVSLILGDQALPIERDAQSPEASGIAAFRIPDDFAAGTYLLRVQVDGVQSALIVDEDEQSDTFEQYVGPLATIT